MKTDLGKYPTFHYQLQTPEAIRRRQTETVKNKNISGACSARKLGVPVNNTLQQWEDAIDYFDGLCAYCGKKLLIHDLNLDHFVPLSATNCPGHVVTNILPTCEHCNHSKNRYEAVGWLTKKFGAEQALKTYCRILVYFARAGK